MRYTGPKVKLARALGCQSVISGSKVKCFVKRPHPPGQHGLSKRPTKKSGYGAQLREIQKLRKTYLLSRTQLNNLFKEADKKAGSTPDNLISFIERRIDVTTWRLGLAPTISAAQQLVSHGHIAVITAKNPTPRRISCRSYRIAVGDTVVLTAKAQKKESVLNLGKMSSPSNFSHFDKGTLTTQPTIESVNPVAHVAEICTSLQYTS